MRRRERTGIAGLVGVLLIVLFCIPSVRAQVQGEWSTPIRLSHEWTDAGLGYPVADQYGNVHVFWAETVPGSERKMILHARYDGQSWTTPIDIYVTRTSTSIENLSPFVDQHGTLHLMWSEGSGGPAYYTQTTIRSDLSAKHWLRPLRVDIPANALKLEIDSRGVLHVLYTKVSGEEAGLYYVRSEDDGATWTQPVWLDPDIPTDFSPSSLQLELDSSGGLHAAWFYTSYTEGGGDWVRYARSLNGGDGWSTPVTIDKQELHNNDQYSLSAARPILAVDGQTVHIVWAGGELHYRHHRYSPDAGKTWSVPTRIFSGLNGQAGDGVAFDAAGRIHYISQIRYPQGIYHAYWDRDHWTSPELAYLISHDPQDPIGDRIHAHGTHPVVRVGNELIVVFSDSPSVEERGLYVMQRTLDDVEPLSAKPTPTPTATPTPKPTETPTPVVPTTTPITAVLSSDVEVAPPSTELPDPGYSFWVGLISPLLLIGGTIVYQLLFRQRH